MLHHAHFGSKGGLSTFAAGMIRVCCAGQCGTSLLRHPRRLKRFDATLFGFRGRVRSKAGVVVGR